MKKLYYVGVFLQDKILFPAYGFTNYADCYTEAESPEEARETAKQYFEIKYKVAVNKTRASVADRRFINPSEVVKPFGQPRPQNYIEQTKNSTNEKETILRPIDGKIKRENPLASFCKRSTIYLNRLFDKRSNNDSSTI
jgi:hypothetical protein